MLEYNRKTVFTSTGRTEWEDVSWATEHAVYIETNAASSAVGQIETRMNGGTATAIVGSTFNSSAAVLLTQILSGHYDQLSVRLTESTGTVTVVMRGNS